MRKLSIAISTAALVVSLAACGSSSSGGPSSSPTANPTAAKAAITHLYETFFSSPVPKAKTLIQDGSALSKAFAFALQLKGKAKETATVHSVTLTGPTTASVSFDVNTNGTPIIQKQTGGAMYVGGHWLVTKDTFCRLLEYAQPKVPGC
jgi:hypothetical protein